MDVFVNAVISVFIFNLLAVPALANAEPIFKAFEAASCRRSIVEFVKGKPKIRTRAETHAVILDIQPDSTEVSFSKPAELLPTGEVLPPKTIARMKFETRLTPAQNTEGSNVLRTGDLLGKKPIVRKETRLQNNKLITHQVKPGKEMYGRIEVQGKKVSLRFQLKEFNLTPKMTTAVSEKFLYITCAVPYHIETAAREYYSDLDDLDGALQSLSKATQGHR